MKIKPNKSKINKINLISLKHFENLVIISLNK